MDRRSEPAVRIEVVTVEPGPVRGSRRHAAQSSQRLVMVVPLDERHELLIPVEADVAVRIKADAPSRRATDPPHDGSVTLRRASLAWRP